MCSNLSGRIRGSPTDRWGEHPILRGHCLRYVPRMSSQTIIIVIVLILLFGGGGFFYSRRR
jgi:hypothetical protein